MPGFIHSIESQAYFESLGASQRCLSILRDGFKLPFLDENVPAFWWKNNQSVFQHFEFAKNKIQEWVDHKYVEKVKEQPAHLSPLSVAERITLTDETKLRYALTHRI